ncbi:MAG: metallophosphoesterase [Bacteroidetes bacterium]|nr:MAG: metallophosphoesterase [Bacteroidota bacterium]
MTEKSLEYGQNTLFVFGGCYSNLQATKRVLEIAHDLGFDSQRIICTGDVVGYCGQPEETVSLIRESGIRCISGNVEIQLANDAPDCGCNFEDGSRCDVLSRSWFPFAQSCLSPESISWMKQLPEHRIFEHDNRQIAVFHGAFDETSRFIFRSTPKEEKEQQFQMTDSEIILCGHSGIPFVQRIGNKLWVNAGVIGMPANDGTTRCWFAIVNPEKLSAELHSFDYDFETARQEMLKHPLPPSYAQTLQEGIWDNCEILPSTETKRQGIPLPTARHWITRE